MNEETNLVESKKNDIFDNQIKPKRNNKNMDQDDPFWETEPEKKSTFTNEDGRNASQFNQSGNSSGTKQINKKIIKEDSDEDLTGWDT